MEAIAKLNYLRIAPRKVRLVADLIRGKSVEQAQAILNFVVKKSSAALLKLLNQSIANAQNNFQLDANNLYVSKIIVDEGPKLKRRRFRSRGQAYEIQKKTSHIVIVLAEKAKTETKTAIKKVSATKEKKVKFSKIIKEKKIPKQSAYVAEQAKIEKRGIKRIFRRKAF